MNRDKIGTQTCYIYCTLRGRIKGAACAISVIQHGLCVESVAQVIHVICTGTWKCITLAQLCIRAPDSLRTSAHICR